jgi:acetoin utilization deacetylase AcuC-like enzyme
MRQNPRPFKKEFVSNGEKSARTSTMGKFQYSVYYSDHYTLELPSDHRFPMAKYRMLRDYLVENKIILESQLRESPLADEDTLALAHDPHYIRSMKDGTIDPQIIKRVGFPWSSQLYVRSCATVGGALAAAKSALETGISGCLAGGTHHAHYDRGEGYCVFNDIAVATRFLQRNRLVAKVAVVDLDVHQGNGNSSILKNDENVMVASIHGEKNYPFKKIPSHFDISLPENVEDELYLKAVDQLLEAVDNFKPDYIFYQMGVDPLQYDRLGKMNISFEGLRERDRKVLRYTLINKIPVSLALGGGYSNPIEKSVEAYGNTYRVVNELYS